MVLRCFLATPQEAGVIDMAAGLRKKSKTGE